MRKHELGLHTKEEQAYARKLADQAYARGLEITRRGELLDLVFEIGMLHAIALIARQEGQAELFQYVSRLKAGLDRQARALGK